MLSSAYNQKYNFVTIEDIVDGPVGLNHVIFNPLLSKERNEQILLKAHRYHFPKTPITEADVDRLTAFSNNETHEFIKAYKKFLFGRED